jgi:hypothetical protein
MAESAVDNSLQQKIEIRHESQHDLVLSSSAKRQDLVQELATKLKNGIPSDWQPFNPDVTGSSDSFVDNVNNPRFFLKQRWYMGDFRDAKIFDASLANAANSITNEIALSPRIKEILTSKQGRKLASSHGLDKIVFVEPLVGIVNRNTQQKALAYEFIDAVPAASESDYEIVNGRAVPSKGSDLEKITDLTKALRQIFYEHGIIATDLYPQQIMRSKDGKIAYLLDAETYYREQSVISAKLPTNSGRRRILGFLNKIANRG